MTRKLFTTAFFACLSMAAFCQTTSKKKTFEPLRLEQTSAQKNKDEQKRKDFEAQKQMKTADAVAEKRKLNAIKNN